MAAGRCLGRRVDDVKQMGGHRVNPGAVDVELVVVGHGGFAKVVRVIN